ncbi:hypothetical protein T484DRAFT_1773113 [Baffinella frigidus]|nr:hypothetical protein T484DRAFT_1773113 [Cryptophyta sp. CCMP2293]
MATEGVMAEMAGGVKELMVNLRDLRALMATEGVMAEMAGGVKELMAQACLPAIEGRKRFMMCHLLIRADSKADMCHLLIRADSKADAVRILLGQDTFGNKPGLLRMFVTLCASRCAAAIPFHSGGLLQAYKQTTQGPDDARCPLGLPAKSRKDTLRCPMPLPALTYSLAEPLKVDPAPYTLHPGSWTLGRAPWTLDPEPWTLHPAP